jgi:hypothetical protein
VYGGDIRGILEQVAHDCPRAWSRAHTDSSERYDYIIEAVKRLYVASGGTVGGNWRRADVGDLSMDGITVLATDNRYYFADIISGAGGSNPTLVFRFDTSNLLRDRSGNYAPHGFVRPSDLPRPVVPCGGATPAPVPPTPAPPTPTPTPAPVPPAVNLDGLVAAVTELSAQVARLEAALVRIEEQVGHLGSRVEAAHQSVLTAIDLGRQQLNTEYAGRIPFAGTVVLRPNRP